MELTRELQDLIDRAWVLYGKLTDEIRKSNKLCRFSRHYNGIAGTQFDEKHRMLAIRDSLREVVEALMLLQRLKSWQEIDRHTALARFEESRCNLLRKVTQYQGRELQLVKELRTQFNGRKSIVYDSNLTDKVKNKAKEGQKKTSSFLISHIKTLLTPWKWRKAVRIAAKLIVLSATISHVRQQKFSSRSLLTRADAQTKDDVIRVPKTTLHVSYGRG
ncbi:hypothetical protein K2173_025222 [Erythroxylum novogranatense]|uniref:Uncharacterized protein n=1 Tax=Erythroxylum novogranatense TaxID=1862640 RepID=A0AAV8UD67_9ROSI|nr:hypothetical protein K2173_025222 [Erythroxylum novogranatense]